jgi:hypothetical protein
MPGSIVLPPSAPPVASWASIRDGMAARLSTIGTLTVKARTPISSTQEDDIAIVEFASPAIQPHGLSSLIAVDLRVIVQTYRATVEDSERAIDAYLWPRGAQSVIAAVQGDPTLGGVVDDTMWLSSGTPYGTPEGNALGRQSEVQFRCALNY